MMRTMQTCEESMHDGHSYYTIKIHNGSETRYCMYVLLEYLVYMITSYREHSQCDDKSKPGGDLLSLQI